MSLARIALLLAASVTPTLIAASWLVAPSSARAQGVSLDTGHPGDTGDEEEEEEDTDSGDEEYIYDTGKDGLTIAELAGEDGGCAGFGDAAALLWLPLLFAIRREEE